MNSKWAEENLQVIRTLMERAALYRRALAPMMLLAGAFAIIGAIGAEIGGVDNLRNFILYWSVIALAVLIGSGLIVRKQAVRNEEQFWTAPARRVFRACMPAMLAGGVIGAAKVLEHIDSPGELAGGAHGLVALWALFYGMGLHAAGSFIAKGIKRLGWCFIGCALGLFVFLSLSREQLISVNPCILMGAVFGGLHLIAGVYLHITEKKDEAA